MHCLPVDTQKRVWNFIPYDTEEHDDGPLYRMYGDTLLAEIFDGKRQWYVFKGDSCLYAGEESRLMKLVPSEPIPTSTFGHFYLGSIKGSNEALSFASYGRVMKGLLTGVYTGKGYESYTYNTDGQLMESYGTGFNNVRTNYTYTYGGQPEKKWWTLPDGGVRTLEWIYDTVGRLTGMKSYMNGTETNASVSYTYDEGGRIIKENYGAVTKSQSYDVAGRPTAVTLTGSSGVKEILAYNAAGRIISKTTKGGTYSFSYDSRGRLKSAINGSSSTAGFSVSYSYDTLSNITSIMRYGVIDKAGSTETFGMLDNLGLTYTGNRLTSVRAISNAVPFEGMTGLGKGSTYGLTYDSSGRLTSDASRGITNIQYNNDGRPISIKLSGGTEQSIEWDNFGNHLSTRYIEVSYTGKPNDRLVRSYTGDGRVIDNYKEAYALFPGGYYKDGTYYRYIKDYQGNNIAVLNSGGSLVQSTDYYPYGEPWREPAGQPWLYSGNERLRMNGVNEYDFNARRYNSALGCFTTWDPLAEKRPWESPYAFCGGDPVNFADPSGLKPTPYEAAMMADLVYAKNLSNTKLPYDLRVANWRISTFSTSVQMNHTKVYESGLQSALFERTVDGKTEYAYVYAGTNSIKDGLEDVRQVAGLSIQYSIAIQNARTLSSEIGDLELTFIGHSLGGGEAAAASMATGREAITFNPAAVSGLTKLFNSLGSSDKIINYRIVPTGDNAVRIGGCWLSNLQQNLGIRAPGRTINIPLDRRNIFKAHKIENFVSFLKNNSK